MKIAIVGPGAMGCLFAAFLSKTDADIVLIDKDSQRAEKINQQGIIVEGVSGSWQAKVKVTSDIKDIGALDLILLCVKSYDTKSACAQVKLLAGENTLVLTLQNGIGNIEILGEIIGQDKIIAGITNLGSTLIGFGHINHAGFGETIIGRMDNKLPAGMRSIREVFNKAGLDTRISRDIKGLLWSKLVINAGINPLSAITRLKNGRLVEAEPARKILRETVTEVVKVIKRKRIKLIFDDPLAKVEAVCEATAGNVSSMLQDVLNNKRTEIDFINGVVVRMAQELGVPAPVNSFLVELVKTIEISYGLSLK
ncbi:MAG: 2-dehydropantoate 2-reductase [Candidatus Omnitrophota bacterium]|nr:2-dehydropantoate 2-reductase [Candidatus Omnitrophota bacterium]MBU1929083.1 2-dehydropantoate 2-reductase [Candidatus Omnitrophota bacterium]MBU1929166.1 2-dehydropantoate 2-reductase [Candidatus Omnitrophota bacterium]MBU2035046.1 2-dehydropantoate 2-reductase [Candidatus Omnitrophota bacterium]MBU2222120.1 2-dehydropantoate 2-reductase [Candidatus Omnitrophota bacterium]